MALLLQNNDEDGQLLSELKDKLDNEVKFENGLNKFFSKVLSAINTDMKKETKSISNIKKKEIDIPVLFGDELNELLVSNYRRGMLTALERFNNDPTVRSLYSATERNRIVEELAVRSETYAQRRAVFIGDEIIKTTEKNLIQSQTFVDKLIESQGLSVTDSERNSLVMDNLSMRVKNRIPTIAATETQNVYQTAKQYASNDLSGKLAQQGKTMQKRWNATLDQNTRPAHQQAHGQRVPTEQLYTVKNQHLMYPGDTSHGASLDNVVNCLHPDSIIDIADIKKVMRRLYNGKMIIIETSSGNKLTVTPNHPILTISGWKQARFLNESDSVISANFRIWPKKSFNIKDIKSSIKQIFNSLNESWRSMRVPGVVVDFHGEIVNEDVDIIFKNGFLRKTNFIIGFNIFNKFHFSNSNLGKTFFFRKTLMYSPAIFYRHISNCIIRSFNKSLSFFKICLRHSKVHRFTSVSLLNSVIIKNSSDSSSRESNSFFNFFNRIVLFKKFYNFINNFWIRNFYIWISNFKSIINKHSPNGSWCSFKFLRKINNRFAHGIKVDHFNRFFFTDSVLSCTQINYSGHVYNLETKSNVYISNGIVNHNCRCESIQFILNG